MKNEHVRHKSRIFYHGPWLFVAALLHITLISAQSTQQPTQEYINSRVDQIMAHDLQQGVFTTSSGVRATLMRADMSMEELNEIKQFGDRAIAPVAEYLHSPDYRAQHLAVNVLGYLGGKNVVKPLSAAAEQSGSSAVRLAAVANLAQHPWPEVSDVIQRVAANDQDPSVKKEAQSAIAKHQSAP
jgi:hypothetical protein